jgi:hypothetical protein
MFVLYFVKPDVSGLNSFKEGVFNSGVCGVPKSGVEVDTPFNPRSIMPSKLHELKNIGVVNIKVDNNSPVLVMPTPAKCFI